MSFREFSFPHRPALQKDLWCGEFWTDGYYASAVGVGGNWAVVEQHVKNQGANTNDLQTTIL